MKEQKLSFEEWFAVLKGLAISQFGFRMAEIKTLLNKSEYRDKYYQGLTPYKAIAEDYD